MNEANKCEWGILGWKLFLSIDEVSIKSPPFLKDSHYEVRGFGVNNFLWVAIKCLLATSLFPEDISKIGWRMDTLLEYRCGVQ